MAERPVILEACGYSLKKKSNWLAGIRKSGFKYVYGPYSETVEEELYDLSTDPNEKTNLSKSMPKKTLELRELLESYYRREGEEFNIETSDNVVDEDLTKEEEDKILSRLKDLGYIE